MATTSSGAQKPSTTTKRSTTRRKPAATGTRTNRTTSTSRTASRTSTTLAERAVLVPVGASLLAQENLVSSMRGLTTRYRTRGGLERELRQRRTSVERSVKQNRRRLEREVRSVRRDPAGTVSAGAARLIAHAQELIGSAS